MGGRRYVLSADGECVTETFFGGAYRDYAPVDATLRPGDPCVIEPMNPQKRLHRGRRCAFLGLRAGSRALRARVRFDDGSTGTVDLSDLVPSPGATAGDVPNDNEPGH